MRDTLSLTNIEKEYTTNFFNIISKTNKYITVENFDSFEKTLEEHVELKRFIVDTNELITDIIYFSAEKKDIKVKNIDDTQINKIVNKFFSLFIRI